MVLLHFLDSVFNQRDPAKADSLIAEDEKETRM
jgi:hypothetical protein